MKKILLIAALLFVGCTENVRARQFGGSVTMNMPCGHKVVNVTWKEGDIWYLTRPMREGEVPETHTFHESSNFGIAEGTILLKECAK